MSFHFLYLTVSYIIECSIGIEQGWPTQLHHWANIFVPILKRAAKLLLMANSNYFTSFSSNFFRHLNKIDLPRKIVPPLKKEVQLDNSKRAAEACQVGRVLDTPGIELTPRNTIVRLYACIKGYGFIHVWFICF